MRAVAGQEQAPILHRFDNETAHRRDAFLQHLAFLKVARAAKPIVQFFPDTLVRPIFDLLIMVTLQIKARQSRRAHGVQREAAIGVRVDYLVIGWRRCRKYTEPPKWIVTLEYA